MKLALLIIDVQNQFFDISPETKCSLNNAIEYINAAIDLFRKKNLPIIAIQHKDEKDNLKPGTKDFEIPESVKLLPSDIRIVKTYGNSFNKTELLQKLKDLNVDTVIITGFCAEYCVLDTCRGAQDCDITPIILRGSLASITIKNIQFVEDINDVITYNVLKKII